MNVPFNYDPAPSTRFGWAFEPDVGPQLYQLRRCNPENAVELLERPIGPVRGDLDRRIGPMPGTLVISFVVAVLMLTTSDPSWGAAANRALWYR